MSKDLAFWLKNRNKGNIRMPKEGKVRVRKRKKEKR